MFKKFLLVSFSILFSLIICEFLLRFFMPQNVGGYFMRQNENGLWIIKNNYKYYDRFNGKTYIYRSGDFNNRITHEYSSKNKKILLLGDSFTFGFRLKDKDTYVSKLQNLFPQYYFINSASPNWGLSDYTKYIENYCENFEWEKVIIFLNTDDIGRVYYSNQYWLENGQIIPGNQGKFNAWYVKYYDYPLIKILITNSHLIRFTATKIVDFSRKKINLMGEKINKDTLKDEIILYPQKILKNKSEVDKLIKKSELIIKRLKEKADSCDLDIYFIYSGWVNFRKNENNFNELNPNVNFFKSAQLIFDSYNIKFFDNSFDPEMRDVNLNRHNYIIQYDHHPNKIGSEKIFNVIKDDIEKILNY